MNESSCPRASSRQLEHRTCDAMEQRFGQVFSGVRVHALHAHADTLGDRIEPPRIEDTRKQNNGAKTRS